MTLPLMRGILIAMFFALVSVALIPIFVPRPNFIPGFAPPPDMWPQIIAVTGFTLGIVATVLAMSNRVAMDLDGPLVSDGASLTTKIMRALAAIVLFVSFALLVPVIGFAISATILTGVSIIFTGERGRIFWVLAISVFGPQLLLLFFHQALGTQFPKGSLIAAFGF